MYCTGCPFDPSDPPGAAPAPPALATVGRRVRGRCSGAGSALPVEVRRAAQWGVQYLVPRDAAQRIVAPTGLEATGPLPGRALVALAVCRYDDTDLDPYHEVAVSFVVRPHDAPPPASAPGRTREFATGAIGVYIHRLPVDQEFTCAAGRDIWGFPKWVTSIDIDEPSPVRRPSRRLATSVRLVDDGLHVLTLIAAGGRHPTAVPGTAELLLRRRRAAPDHLDDVLGGDHGPLRGGDA